MTVASNRRNTDAQRHDKRYGHRSGCHPAGVKGNRPEIFWHKHRHQEDDDIKSNQQDIQADSKQDSQHGDDQKDADSKRHRSDQRRVRYIRHLVGEHLQIRLRDGDDDTEQKADEYNHPNLSGFCNTASDLRSDRGHRCIRTQGKKGHPHDQQDRSHQKGDEHVVGNRRYRKAKQQHNDGNRKYGRERFLKLIV